MNKTYAFIAAVVFLLVAAPVSRAEEKVAEFSEKTKEICNRIILNVYKDVLKSKGKYPELMNFDEKALKKNDLGIYSIVYLDTSPQALGKRKAPFEMGLTIDRVDDATFADKANSFNFAFPLLGLKFSGYQTKRMLRTQYNLMPLVNKHGTILEDYQQEFMPLKLIVKPLKDAYKVRENIEFEVTLKNVSNRHMQVKDLSRKTLFFILGDMAWGTSPNSGQRGGNKKSVILKAGESLTLKFTGESFQKPRDVEIYCAYKMSIKGVNPSSTLRVKVVENQ